MIASAATSLPFVLLALACPLMMVFMMRGGHRHGGQARADACDDSDRENGREQTSLEELRGRIDELEAQLRAREAEEGEAQRLTSTG